DAGGGAGRGDVDAAAAGAGNRIRRARLGDPGGGEQQHGLSAAGFQPGTGALHQPGAVALRQHPQ
ncbi:hypothetical protein CEJ63_23905, partial [Acinetobacter baumannii]